MRQLELPGLGIGATAWVEWVVARVRVHVSMHGEVTPDDVQDFCIRADRYPPHPSCHGRLWDRLRRLGLERTSEEQTSRIPSNNGRKVHVWRPGQRWGRES